MRRYAIDMTNRATVYRNTASAAVDYARGQLYLGDRDQADALNALIAGHGYVYSYGFFSASIMPIADGQHECVNGCSCASDAARGL